MTLTRMGNEKSENVAQACSVCGGGEGGFIKRSGPGLHADWCPTHNATMRLIFVRHTNFVPIVEREEQKERIENRRQFTADLREDGYPVRQIAEMLGVSSWTVREDLAEMDKRDG